MMCPIAYTGFFGLVVIMDRCIPLFLNGSAQDWWDDMAYIKKVFEPIWYVKDFKPENFGYTYSGQFVCLDYGEG